MSNSLALLRREWYRGAHILGANLKGGSEDLNRQGGKTAENRTLTDVIRRYFGICGRFSVVSQRWKGPGILHPRFQPTFGRFLAVLCLCIGLACPMFCLWQDHAEGWGVKKLVPSLETHGGNMSFAGIPGKSPGISRTPGRSGANNISKPNLRNSKIWLKQP